MIQAQTLKLFNDKELTYLSLTYQGLNKKDIAKELQLNNTRAHVDIERLIFDKLSVNNWYNAFRRAFHLQLLNREDFLPIDIQEQASKVSNKIMKILRSTRINDKEKELAVYLALLSFQIKVEHSYLFKGKEK
ncbi:hypothetical protein Q4Q39_16010 [Flavivirga amylovorans]|uniref:HTH luxR-type domain-containing protein n=1 Tax=Flavivirga amylovorans TaxID=870486 RepID=A0ABT8X5S6_9FLAO|nr:hypothetical protein [Flavivirga amylovorans]MDO5988915.1 hypothetical protein [Flavivirga amylovorans]